MCGIAGRFNHRSDAPVRREDLAKMADLIRHRGPDGEGFFVDGAIGLAHRRLAIIDIEGGQQPMANADESLWLSYNGEVYNYIELRDQLERLGHRFRTRSDTEVVLAAYEKWGLSFAEHFNGMFALAIWDKKARQLVLCRDRMGIKPLYYAMTAHGVAFASELKALVSVDGVKTTLDLHALDEYMTCGYVVNPRSLLRGISKVAPGSVMVFSADRQEPLVSRYWELAFRPDFERSVEDWSAEIRDTFTDAVRLQLRSDVPLGTLLSGGVDSTLIASTMAKLRSDPASIHSFCVGIDVPGAITEFDMARKVASQLGLRHHEHRLSEQQFADTLLDAAQLLDEPLVEPMVGQLLAVCRFARERLTVVLSGEGADETWFGYQSYRLHGAISLLQRVVPKALLGLAVSAADSAAAHLPIPPKFTKHMRNLTEPLQRRYLGLNHFDIKLKNSLYSPEVRNALAGHDSRATMSRLYEDDVGGPEAISRMAAVDCRAWLVDNTLMRSDHMSMAASLELRVPFLDHRLVELAARVPARLKVQLDSQKVILKTALAQHLPPGVAKRRKVGFPTPLRQLFKGAFGATVAEHFRSPSNTTKPLFDHQRALRLLDQHRSGKANWSKVLFQLMMLEYWGKRFDVTL